MSYSEKLKDPRWDKKRKEILKRDKFSCQLCESVETELQVHHKYYITNTDPWDYEDECFISLCTSCHKEEHAKLDRIKSQLFNVMKRNFMADDMVSICNGFLSR